MLEVRLGSSANTGQDLEVRRRYSEFASLRDALSRLHPTLVMPPIPEKHTMADYAANPTKAKQDQQIIDLRKRMLAVFLNRCRRMDAVRNDGVWWRFLDPNSSWVRLMWSDMMCILTCFPERSPSFTPYRIYPEEQPQSPSSRPCQPNTCARLASHSRLLREAQRNFKLYHERSRYAEPTHRIRS